MWNFLSPYALLVHTLVVTMFPSSNGLPQVSWTVPFVGSSSFFEASPQAHTVYNVVPLSMFLISAMACSTLFFFRALLNL